MFNSRVALSFTLILGVHGYAIAQTPTQPNPNVAPPIATPTTPIPQASPNPPTSVPAPNLPSQSTGSSAAPKPGDPSPLPPQVK